MATLKVIPITRPPETITQRELIEFAVLRKKLREQEAEFATREQQLIDRLKNGAAVECGLRTVRLNSTYSRTVRWKTVAIRLARRLGYDAHAYILNVTKNTKGTIEMSLYMGDLIPKRQRCGLR